MAENIYKEEDNLKKVYKEKDHHPFENQIFNHYRKTAKEINEAIKLLVEHNYRVIDHQGKWITKENIN
jgi:hypothetical protein